MATSAVYVFEYLFGLFIFGLVYWIMDAILRGIAPISVQDNTYLLAMMLWAGILLVYLVFGIYYLIIRIKTWNFFRGE
jgi:hypothetical protein